MKAYCYDEQSGLYTGETEATAGDVPRSWTYPAGSTLSAPPDVTSDKVTRWNGVQWEIRERTSAEVEAKRAAEAREAMEKAPAVLAATKSLARAVGPTMPDNAAVAIAKAFPEAFRSWTSREKYATNEVLTHGGKIYRVVQDVTAQSHQPPGAEGMLAVYRPVFSATAGTKTDPIPFENGLDAENGKYYSYKGGVYLCKSDMKPCVWAPGTNGLWQWEFVGAMA